MAGEDELFQMDLNLHPNEASGLLTIGNEALLGDHGWDIGFWAVLDEGEIEDCVAAIGHRRGSPEDEGWEIERLHASASGNAGKTEDAEAITLDEDTGYVYILGSHFGSKGGPLQPKRGFVARFREAEVGRVAEDPAMRLQVSRQSFALHRLINDALEESDLDLIPLGEQTREGLIEATIERGEEKAKKWAGLVREDDYPINIEGAAFRENGNLLLGLRFPTTAQGKPILIELHGIERLFDGKDDLPAVAGFWTAEAVGRNGKIAGVRDLALLKTENGEELHLVTGNVDSRDTERPRPGLPRRQGDRGHTLPVHPSPRLLLRPSRNGVRTRIPQPSAYRGYRRHPRRPHLLRHGRGRGRTPAAHAPARGLARCPGRRNLVPPGRAVLDRPLPE
jgi:hypothetical protein